MNDLLADQIEWLLTNTSNSNRLGKQLITLVGFLADETLPEHISQQVAALSRLVVRQDMFDALVNSLNGLSRGGLLARPDKSVSENGSSDFAHLVAQIEAARLDVSAIESVNYSELIAWVIFRGRQLKILKAHGGRR